MDLETNVRYIPGVGPLMGEKLHLLNISTVWDLINHFPFRFNDFTNFSQISQLRIGESVTIQGQVWSIANTYTRSKKILTKAILNDGSGSIELTWFNQPYLTKSIKSSDLLQVSGKVAKFGSKLTLLAPVWEKSESQAISTQLHTGRLVPVYPEIEGISSKWLRSKISQVLPQIIPQIKDPLPEFLTKDYLSLKEAYQKIHFPEKLEEFNKAWERLAFDELFFVSLSTLKKRMEWQKTTTVQPIVISSEKKDQFISSLPFALTSAQKKVIDEIISDLKQTHPMNRLVQGDVGSGKTIVAVINAYLIFLNNLRTVIMAPTEILASQHYQTLDRFLTPLGVKVGLYTGSQKFTKSSNSQNPDVIVGTHALLSNKLEFEKIGLVVIDEQQRFGVEQRSYLRSKTSTPHFLTMTATPIPRTIALTTYGDLDLSIIDELPKGRKMIKTFFIPQKKREDVYRFISKEISQGRQAYVITPLIEESETLISAKAAIVEFENLSKKVFPNFKLGLLHGRLKPKEKQEVITKFKERKIDILVSTSVVEVGVDIPNATIMLIEGAERFGLAQLHQLRGRVGRGETQSYTFLFAETESPQIVNRLKHLESIHDGLKLAELDLKIRGSGELFGTHQSGNWSFKLALPSDIGLIEEARNGALKVLSEDPELDKYPLLAGKLQHQKEIMPD